MSTQDNSETLDMLEEVAVGGEEGSNNEVEEEAEATTSSNGASDVEEHSSSTNESPDGSTSDFAENTEEVITSSLVRNSTKSVLEDAEWQFGGAAYHSRYRNGFISFIPYRDAGCIYSVLRRRTASQELFSTDPELIANLLSKLSWGELNQIDKKTGQNLLHVAVKYNRAGKISRFHDTGREYVQSMLPSENIVQWFLRNPNFVRVHCLDKCGFNAFHTALDAQISLRPEVSSIFSIEFCSENHGGRFGCCFVANGALRTLLEDTDYCTFALNMPNSDGLTPMAFGMKKSVRRIRSQQQIFFRDERGRETVSFSDRIDISIADFTCDYIDAIKKILKHPKLRLHGMFGVTESGILPFVDPRFCRLALLEPSMDLLALRQFCYGTDDSFYPFDDKGSKVPGHAPVVEYLLNNKVGALEGKIKAQVLATSLVVASCSKQTSKIFCWAFDPRKFQDKDIKKVLCKIFAKYSMECREAIHIFQDELIKEAKLLLEVPSGQQVADWNVFVSTECQHLEAMFRELDFIEFNFFLEKYFLFLQKKYKLPSECWENVLLFLGWMRRFPEIPSKTTLLSARKRRHNSDSE